MNDLQWAKWKRLVTNVIVIGAPLVAALESVKGHLPASVAAAVTFLSLVLKQLQSHLDLAAEAK